jgi:hypothetical protein
MILKWIVQDYASFKVRYRALRCESGGGYSVYLKTDNFLASWRPSKESVATGSRYNTILELQQGESLQLNGTFIVDYALGLLSKFWPNFRLDFRSFGFGLFNTLKEKN